MTSKKGPVLLGSIMALTAFGTYHLVSAQVTGPSGLLHVAASEEIREHVHSVALRQADVAAELADGDETGLALLSSEGTDEGPTGPLHSHTIRLTEADLESLSSTGEVTITSDEALGHTHRFEFLDENCTVVTRPGTTPSASPSVSPSVSPSANPSSEPSETPPSETPPRDPPTIPPIYFPDGGSRS